jgi:cell division protein FtsW (lipid II flippase)
VWIAIAVCVTLLTYFTHNEYNNKWFVVVERLAYSIIVLPILFLMTVLYFRFFRVTRSRLDEFTSPDDHQQAGG